MIQNIQHFTWKTQLFLKPLQRMEGLVHMIFLLRGMIFSLFFGWKNLCFFFFGGKIWESSNQNPVDQMEKEDQKNRSDQLAFCRWLWFKMSWSHLQKWRIPKPRYVWKLYKWCQRLIFLGPSGVPIFSPEGQTSSNLSSYPSRRSAFRQWNFGIER